MGLPERFDSRLRRDLGLRAAWLPGSKIELGDILQREEGIFQQVANLSDFKIGFTVQSLKNAQSLTFQSRGISTTIVQGTARVDLQNLDPEASAELKIEFKSENTYFLRTPRLSGIGISNLLKVGRTIRDEPEWDHKRYYFVSKVYEADEFVFLASESGDTTIRFGGKGSAIKNFLDVGASANIARISAKNVGIEIIGSGGPVAIGVVRVKRDGKIWFR